ncbi:MAG TPA: FtsX-like permease family protein [Myxococcales bacterium]
MRGRLEMLGIIVQIALRNLFASRLKTVIVGGIIASLSALVVLGTSLLFSIVDGMSQSIVGSIAGDLHVTNSESKDDVALYGGMMGEPDLRPMEDFSKVKKTLLSVPNVKTVVPMGVAQAMPSSGNALDLALERLRGAVKKRVAGEASASEAEAEAEYASLKDHVRQNIGLLQKDMSSLTVMVDEKTLDPGMLEDLNLAARDAFWAGFDRDPLASLEFLENKIAPLSVDGDFIFVRYVATDLDAYQQAFARMQILEGQMVPKGQRGILFPKLYYEEWVKLKTALRLDKIKEARDVNQRRIADDVELRRFVKENVRQVREIVVQLDSLKTKELVSRLQRGLDSGETDVSKLLEKLLETTDENFDARYALYYAQVAPLVKLYVMGPGDTITIKAFSKSGYLKSVNVKLYGIYAFKGLEKSGFAGMVSLLDLMTFRDLYGYLGADQVAEIKQLKEAAGSKAVDRDRAEAELFGGGGELVAEVKPAVFEDPAAALGSIARQDNEKRVYTKEEIEQGVAISAAIQLHDPSRADQTMLDIQRAAQRDGLKLKVVGWKKAAGMVGQLVTMLAVSVAVILGIIFVIAVIIIANAMVMATLQRVKEVGTVRAIGGQRRFVLGMVAVETLAIGLFFGLIGAVVGALLVELLGVVGIPAYSQEMQFVFSGPRLFPSLSGIALLVALATVLVVSFLSCLYPAFIATRITPLEAMQSED